MATANSSDINATESIDAEYIPVPFLSVYERLPAGASVHHPHIIDTYLWSKHLSQDKKLHNVKIQDAVATILYKMSKDILGQFLDKRTTYFKLAQWTEFDHKRARLVIWKEGAQVLVGYYFEHVEDNLLYWSNVIRCTVNFDGSWNLLSAKSYTSTKRGLLYAWSENFIPGRWDGESSADITEEDIVHGFSKSMISMQCDDEMEYKREIAITMAD
ncbi:uncharacterized protein J4E92_004776 [Alternaria infectoria]|uniref:uncharacterized protein n=1 Tax=Alternaria infectoria TaxID=45303 RepID=UPI00221EFB72|nr:uncharacterized protein J4E92_004776 [Alternaria infectoria]KAI4930942.1 hypothetical protein J4E92_004776 [Alternaria infectoria]